MTIQPMVNDPVMRVEWRDAAALNANFWNPNVVATPELRLLELSILRQGWIQPILINEAGVIIDGFHRWRLSIDSKGIATLYKGKVPCVVLPLSEPEAMLLTVRINRAKGFHVATRMHALVTRLIDEFHCPLEQVARDIGATVEEVRLLSQENIFKARNLKDYKYSKAWYPAEDGKRKAADA